MKGKILVERLKDIRNDLDWTQKTLAEQTDLSLSLIRNIECGRAGTSKDSMKKIAKALEVPLEEIYIQDFRVTKVIAVANNKGGSGKTTVVGNLGYALSEIKDTKVLLIDGDMQMNLTRSYGLERMEQKSLYQAIMDETPLDHFIHTTKYENIDFIASDYRLSSIDLNLFTKTFRETVFKRLLQPILDQGIYDYILIDTCPTLGYLNYNILNATDYVIIPVELSAFGIDGLEPLMEFFSTIKVINPKIEVAGVLRTKVDKRESTTPKVEADLIGIFGTKIFENYIPVDINIKKSQFENLPLIKYMDKSRASVSYKKLAKEVLNVVK